MTTLNLQQLRERLESTPRPLLVEALPEEHFANSHLPGAVNIPKDRVNALAPRLLPDRNAEIIVYCANAECQASGEVVQQLIELGYTNVADFEEGKKGWLEAGLPIENGVATAA